MSSNKQFRFSVLKRFKEYLHFNIEYSYGSNSCHAQGMAWILEGKVFYYLSDVYLNNAYAYPKYLNLAGVKESHSRIVFFDPEMVDLLNGYVKDNYDPE